MSQNERIERIRAKLTDRSKFILNYALKYSGKRDNLARTDHLLMGMIAETTGVASHVLSNIGLVKASQIEEIVNKNLEAIVTSSKINITADSQTPEGYSKSLESTLYAAEDVATGLCHSYIGTEHLLLGLLATPCSSGYAALTQYCEQSGEVEIGELKQRVLDILGIFQEPDAKQSEVLQEITSLMFEYYSEKRSAQSTLDSIFELLTEKLVY